MKCQKHVNVVHGQFCPICLVEERNALRSEVNVLTMALAAERERLLDLELIADVQHEIWSKWMRHLFKVSQGWIDGSVSIPADKVNRWKYQMNTPYYELSENEKDSDRHQADLVIRAIRSAEEGE